MSFSRAQNGKYRPLVEAAWQAVCKAEEADPCDRAAREAWYRGELQKCVGQTSTVLCNRGRDFDKLMAHFEAIARNDCVWVLREQQGEFRRVRHVIARLCERWDIDDAYARATAVRVLKWPGHLASLDEIKHLDDLHKVRQALFIHAKRLERKSGAANENPAAYVSQSPRHRPRSKQQSASPRRIRFEAPAPGEATNAPDAAADISENCPF